MIIYKLVDFIFSSFTENKLDKFRENWKEKYLVMPGTTYICPHYSIINILYLWGYISLNYEPTLTLYY
jgi:hypothetical protein